MRLILDTNRLTDALDGKHHAVDTLEGASRVFVPFITLAEIRAGFASGDSKRTRENKATLDRFLALPSVEELYPDAGTTLAWATLKAYLRRVDRPIPVNDLWIAALAHQHGLTVYSRDGHFKNLPQIPTL